MDVVITTLAIFVFHTTGVRFQTVACMLTRTTIYPTTTSIPPVRSPFVMLQQSHNMLIPTQTAAASGNVDQPQLLRLASWSAPLAAGLNLQIFSAYKLARTGTGSCTIQKYLMNGTLFNGMENI